MWKFVSRSLRNTFRSSRNSRSARGKNVLRTSHLHRNRNILTPKVIDSFGSRFGSAKENKTSGDNESRWETKHTWQDAVRWSGAIAIGWIVCQSLCLRKTLDEIWSHSSPYIPLDQIRNFKPRKMLSLKQLNDLEQKESTQTLYNPIAFGSINHEEFDMLLHRQQSF